MMVKLHIILVLLPLCCVLSQEDEENEYTYYPGIGYYKYHNETESWFGAWTACYNERANLVVVNTQEERDLIFQILHNHYREWTWVGVHSLFENNIDIFVTVHGERMETLTYMQWVVGQPSDQSDLCVALDEDSMMENWDCSTYNPFICEIS